MKNVYALISIILIFFGVIVSSFIGVTLVTTSVLGVNQTNDTSLARMYVWNTEPNITAVVISPEVINLNPSNTSTQVNCTGYVYDYNGWRDISAVNATLYNTLNGSFGDADNNYRYINASCGNATEACTEITANNASCTCSFAVWYYASPGTWRCNMTITDDAGNATDPSRYYYINDSEESGDANVSRLLGVAALVEEIDYGNLSVTEISDQKSINISNYGNVPINLSVRGYGGVDDYYNTGSTLMICEYGNMSVGYHRYSAESATTFALMQNLSNTSTSMNYTDLPVRINDTDYGDDTNATFWRLEIPLSVGGHCNGTIDFIAVET